MCRKKDETRLKEKEREGEWEKRPKQKRVIEEKSVQKQGIR